MMRAPLLALVLWLLAAGAATAADRVDMPLRGRMALTIYRRADHPKGTVIMGAATSGGSASLPRVRRNCQTTVTWSSA